MFCDNLRQSGIGFEYLSFPDYSTSIGQEIRHYLALKREYSVETAHLLYSANRYEHLSSILKWIAEKKIVVLNRYCESNIAYGVADGLPRFWLEQLESRLPQSDYVIYLRVTPETSLKRKDARDRFEADSKFLSRVSQVYDALAVPPRWFIVNGERETDIIHYEIMKTLSAVLKEKGKIFNVQGHSNTSETSSFNESTTL